LDVLKAKADLLRGLHHGDELLVLPNAWDCMSARVLEDCGYPAIATTSAGIAWAFGYPDGEGLGRDEMAEATARIAGAVSVPVTADAEAGYGATPDAASETALAVIRAGAAGLNLEDPVDTEPPGGVGSFGKGDSSVLVELEEQAEKIRAAVEAGREAGMPLVVNARTDVYWRRSGIPMNALRRRVKDPDTIAALVREIPGPLNMLAGPGSPTFAELARLGVRRVSVGSGPARAAMGLTRRIGQELLRSGTYSSLGGDALPYAEANALFEGHSRSEPPREI
jgi:2-methylisocitrate lyase-like PEP mutase family enzyme